jgi:hypothetical protein
VSIVFKLQPSVVLASNAFAVSNGVVSVGCQNLFNDNRGSLTTTAVLFRSPDNPGVYAPTLLSLLLKRSIGSNRTSISDMYLAIYRDDGSSVQWPGSMVSGKIAAETK